jgi:ribosomal protein S18 acetylase RimI-like enzyme
VLRVYQADNLHDLAACLALDGSYETDRVWQVAQQGDDDQITTCFRTMELPRAIRVPYPSWSEALLAHQERGDLILVAAEASEVLGYINQESQPDLAMAWVHHLVVSPACRRQGIGTVLLGRGMQNARHQGLMQIMMVVQSKNYPAIRFLQRHGFTLCGYNERFYRNLDIGLYFGRGL